MVVEVTCRTVQGRFLLKSSPLLNRLAIGVLGRAQRMYDVRIHAFCVMSNHYHLLVTVQNALQLARFMTFVQSNLAREAGRLVDWKERFWGRRYQAILVSHEPAAQLARLRYILSQGCKEGIVLRPEDWPGANCVKELLNGKTTLEGQWIDRTALYRMGGKEARDLSKVTTAETVFLSPLPHFDKVEESQRLEWIRNCVDQIADEARREHGAVHRVRSRRMRQRDVERRQPMKRTRAPWFHVSSPGSGGELREGYALFVALYRSAARRLKAGLDAVFPEGSFPPPRPYVAGVTNPASS
jgi:putative transposase